jgi:hypothetical protein
MGKYINREGNQKLHDFIYFSQDFLYAVKTESDPQKYIDTLANLNLNQLTTDLNSREKKLAFWLNIYNALAQYYLQNKIEIYKKSKNQFFSQNYIIFGGRKISLDLIENGVLRHSKFKYGLGYIGKLFPSEFEKIFRLDTVDSRIHFALNCGANSCPAIAFYKPEEIDEQLNSASMFYLQAETIYDKEKNEIYLPAVMNWFKGDFGGKSGIYIILQKYEIIPQHIRPKIKFKKYDWALNPKKYVEQDK